MQRGATQRREFRYNAEQRLHTVTHPESGMTTYTYHPSSGMLQTKTDQKGQVVQYGYDGLKRLTSITRSSGGVVDPCQGVSLFYDFQSTRM